MQEPRNSTLPIVPESVDIRLAIGKPYRDNPIMVHCPFHADKTASLAVYRSNIHCMACGYHLSRRYSSLAFLLGRWDGRGDENSVEVRQICRGLGDVLPTLLNGGVERSGGEVVQPLDPYLPQTFHQYLLRYEQDRLHDELLVKRGYTLETVKQYTLGHSGTHWSIPVYSRTGELITIRYRADDTRTDKGASNYRKYEGTKGHNETVLYPLPVVSGMQYIEELWIPEGEHDSIAINQAGSIALTAINGSSQAHKVPAMVADLGIEVGRWVISTDQDSAGEQAAGEIATTLINRGQPCVRARWDYEKDMSAYLAIGAGLEGVWYERAYS